MPARLGNPVDEKFIVLLMTIPSWLVSVAAFVSTIDLIIVAYQSRDGTMVGSILIRFIISVSYALFTIADSSCDIRGAIIRACVFFLMVNDGLSRFLLFWRVRKLLVAATSLEKEQFNQGGIYFFVSYIWINRERIARNTWGKIRR